MTPQELRDAVLHIVREHGPIQNMDIRGLLPSEMWDHVSRVDRAISVLRKDGMIRRDGIKWVEVAAVEWEAALQAEAVAAALAFEPLRKDRQALYEAVRGQHGSLTTVTNAERVSFAMGYIECATRLKEKS